MEGRSLLSVRQMVVWLLLSCQLAKERKTERKGLRERERGRDEPFLYFFISSFNLSLTFTASSISPYPSLSFCPLFFSPQAIKVCVWIHVFVAHPSHVTIFYLYFVFFFPMCSSISPSLSLYPCLCSSRYHYRRKWLQPAKFGYMKQKQTEGERRKNLRNVGSHSPTLLLKAGDSLLNLLKENTSGQWKHTQL